MKPCLPNLAEGSSAVVHRVYKSSWLLITVRVLSFCAALWRSWRSTLSKPHWLCNGTQHVRADRDHLVNARACICKAQCNAIQLLNY